MSIGGWTYSKLMHTFMHTDADRKRMVSSCVAMLDEYKDVFGGIDIDLEMPCFPEDSPCGPGIIPSDDDKGHFTLFIKEWRAQMGNRHLTVATFSPDKYARAIDFPAIDHMVDSYNIMTYDFTSGSWGDKYTGHQTNPRPVPNDPVEYRR